MSHDNQINELTRLFKENTHDENAVHMSQYMKGHFLFLASKVPSDETSRENDGKDIQSILKMIFSRLFQPCGYWTKGNINILGLTWESSTKNILHRHLFFLYKN